LATHHETITRNESNSSPRHFVTTSFTPVVNRALTNSSNAHRVHNTMQQNSEDNTYRVIREQQQYKTTSKSFSNDPHSGSSQEPLVKNNSLRRDSWDVINKTKNILSHNSLESLANMTENQLNTDLSYSRDEGATQSGSIRETAMVDHETERNTRYNKFALFSEEPLSNQNVHQLPTVNKFYSDNSDYKTTAKSSSNYVSTMKESNERFVRINEELEKGNAFAKFRPIDKDTSGADTIRVQNIEEGVLGRPVEFQSNKI